MKALFRNLIIPATLLLALPLSAADFKSVTFKSADGLTISADLYGKKKPAKTIILLFHQASYSRGEYRSIAPLLLKLGFDSLAVDLRSGYRAKGVLNETAKRAVAQGKKTTYIYALPDMKAALKYARKQGYKRIILWGSSYSAGLALKLAAETKPAPLAVVAFSPGEYFGSRNFVGKSLPGLRSKAWVTSTRSEKRRTESLYKQIKSGQVTYFLPLRGAGTHGSKAIWKTSKWHRDYRKSLFKFLGQFQN